MHGHGAKGSRGERGYEDHVAQPLHSAMAWRVEPSITLHWCHWCEAGKQAVGMERGGEAVGGLPDAER